MQPKTSSQDLGQKPGRGNEPAAMPVYPSSPLWGCAVVPHPERQQLIFNYGPTLGARALLLSSGPGKPAWPRAQPFTPSFPVCFLVISVPRSFSSPSLIILLVLARRQARVWAISDTRGHFAETHASQADRKIHFSKIYILAPSMTGGSFTTQDLPWPIIFHLYGQQWNILPTESEEQDIFQLFPV